MTGRGSLLLSLSAALIGVLVLPGCGGSHAKRSSSVTLPSTQLHDAIRVPRATELRPGMSVRVRSSILKTVGWQVACAANDKRVTAEEVRGQRTAYGRVAGFKGGSPSIWVTHNDEGSITVSCR